MGQRHWGDGHNAFLLGQTALDDINNLTNYDILIVTSDTGALTGTRMGVIEAFFTSGRGVYIQTEYQATYTSNQTFANVANNNGGTFSWLGEVAGQLNPVTIVGCYASEPEVVTQLTYFWYAREGSGSNGVVPMLVKNGQNIGFSFCRVGGGLVATTTDQDWVRITNLTADGDILIRNIISRLAFASTCQ